MNEVSPFEEVREVHVHVYFTTKLQFAASEFLFSLNLCYIFMVFAERL